MGSTGLGPKKPQSNKGQYIVPICRNALEVGSDHLNHINLTMTIKKKTSKFPIKDGMESQGPRHLTR